MKIINEVVEVKIVEQTAEFAQYVSLDDDPRFIALKVGVVALWAVIAVGSVMLWKMSKSN